jgi:DNA polymerase-4/DNA polymerase V
MFERVILHFDGDSFFASVEQVMDYRLRGRPLVTGGERGAITSASIEAKRLGINRGVSLRDAKKLCPELAVVSGDYVSYAIFAERMYSIVREFTPLIEEYSIDECFADITGLDRILKMSYADIAIAIKKKLETSLGITFGVGLGPNKVLAKVASKHRKPAGFTIIGKNNLESFLKNLPLGKVWGIGPSTSIALSKLGVFTALDFASKTSGWVDHHHIPKPYRETWLELQGYFQKELSLEPDIPKSIIRSRTFSPPSSDKEFVFSQLSKNIEAASAKARSHGLRAGSLYFYLKTQDFRYQGKDISLTVPSSSPTDIISLVKKYFGEVWRSGVLYRASGISLRGFISDNETTHDLFGESVKTEKNAVVFRCLDKLSAKYGEHTIFMGSSLRALTFSGVDSGRPLDIPMVGKVK